MSDIERRFSTAPVSLRPAPAGSTTSGRTVRGYAAVFNSRSEILSDRNGPFVELLAPGAFADRLNDDVVATLNHDDNYILARSRGGSGSLQLGTDSTGLWFQFEAPNTSAGNDLVELMRRGDLDRCSFAFSVAPGGDSWISEGKTRVRTIRKIGRLADVSVVASPAYQSTSATVRDGSAPDSKGIPSLLGLTPAQAARFGLPKIPQQPAPRSMIHSSKRSEVWR